jgi:hypothetical protein
MQAVEVGEDAVLVFRMPTTALPAPVAAEARDEQIWAAKPAQRPRRNDSASEPD